MSTLLITSGAVTLVLGLLHFFFPYLLDFENAIPREGKPLKEFRMPFVRHPTSRDDVRTVVRLMNDLVSFTLVSIGLIDLVNHYWLGNTLAPFILGWITVWWVVRLGYQLAFPPTGKSLMLAALFLLLAILHGYAAIFVN